MIEFNCNCGQPLRTDDVNRGGAVTCPECGKRQAVPNNNEHVSPDRIPATGGFKPEPDAPRRRRFEEEPELTEPVGRVSTSGMAITSLLLGISAFACSILTGLPALILGFRALSDIRESHGRLKGSGLASTGIALGIAGMVIGLVIAPFALIFPAIQKTRQAAERMSSANNMKQQSLAMMNYESSTGRLPDAYKLLDSPAGGPPKVGLGWRVELLPYLEQEPLYHSLNPQEPWDGPSNQYLQSALVKTYLLPGDTTAPATHTYYQVFVTAAGKRPHAAFNDPTDRVRVTTTHFTDGVSNTIRIAEAPTAVPWASPQDMRFDPDLPTPALGTHFPAGSMIGLGDGSVRFLPHNTTDAIRRAYITRDGDEPIPIPDW